VARINLNYQQAADTEDELEVLQKAYIDLGLARTIASTIKSDLKHRSTLINKNNASIDEIKQVN
jgi:outer membrane protein assembly factor BamD (BamD/ComL family)